ncbi:hypothetical protein MUK42_19509 [Musa troglodytarum]|uniref:Uncharacterized protein n=1 Tax=Musa troglodytarum TaxID=320322 RepID=A0A9E7EIE5_9LILI|nr:hypothetical protein MUK42_19509 [Musa troglodytarum]
MCSVVDKALSTVEQYDGHCPNAVGSREGTGRVISLAFQGGGLSRIKYTAQAKGVSGRGRETPGLSARPLALRKGAAPPPRVGLGRLRHYALPAVPSPRDDGCPPEVAALLLSFISCMATGHLIVRPENEGARGGGGLIRFRTNLHSRLRSSSSSSVLFITVNSKGYSRLDPFELSKQYDGRRPSCPLQQLRMSPGLGRGHQELDKQSVPAMALHRLGEND